MSRVVPAVQTYDGTSLDTDVDGDPRLTARLVRGLDTSPAVRGKDTVIPVASGQVPRDRVRDSRIIEIEVTVMGTGATEAEQLEDTRDALNALGALFAPTGQPATLVVEVEDGTLRSISARPINTLHDDGEVPTRRTLSIELLAVEDDWVTPPPPP